MKNKEFYKLLKKNKYKSDSGFTLTELLVGLFMSIFVVGALGFGLVQVLRITQEDSSSSQARSETTRAVDFITDEIRRAKTIESDDTNAGTDFNNANKTIVLALDIPEISNAAATSAARGRVVYYLKSTGLGNWEGPQVLYRWGPPLDQDGNYTNGTWVEEALIDKIGDTNVTSNPCDTGQTINPPITETTKPSGFYVCIDDDDNDGIVENETIDTDGDGIIENEDIDGVGISAQLYFTSGVDTAAGENKSNYSTNVRVIARARTPQDNNPGLNAPSQVFFRSLGAVYGCNPSDNSSWSMRTDFANNIDDPNNSTKWVHREGEDRQPQPLKITNKKLKITSVPIEPGNSVCLNDSNPNRIRGNRDLSASESLYETDSNGDYVMDGSEFTATTDNKHTVEHIIDFDDPTTFNGLEKDNPSRDDKFVMGTDQRVVFLKNGTVLSESFLTRGYDPDNDSTNNDTSDSDQKSLVEFLIDKEYINAGSNTITGLRPNERIVAFEIGWEDNTQPGFDVQDNVFLMTSDLFTKKFESTDF